MLTVDLRSLCSWDTTALPRSLPYGSSQNVRHASDFEPQLAEGLHTVSINSLLALLNARRQLNEGTVFLVAPSMVADLPAIDDILGIDADKCVPVSLSRHAWP